MPHDQQLHRLARHHDHLAHGQAVTAAHQQAPGRHHHALVCLPLLCLLLQSTRLRQATVLQVRTSRHQLKVLLLPDLHHPEHGHLRHARLLARLQLGVTQWTPRDQQLHRLARRHDHLAHDQAVTAAHKQAPGHHHHALV